MTTTLARVGHADVATLALLPNGDFAAGLAGWTVVELSAVGTTWNAGPDGLRVRGAAATGSAMGSVLLFSPRRPAVAGRWEGAVELEVGAPVRVDLAIVVDAAVPVPGPPPVPPAACAFDVRPGPVATLRTERRVPACVRSVGLRLTLPAGVDVVLRAARLAPPAGAAAATCARVRRHRRHRALPRRRARRPVGTVAGAAAAGAAASRPSTRRCSSCATPTARHRTARFLRRSSRAPSSTSRPTVAASSSSRPEPPARPAWRPPCSVAGGTPWTRTPPPGARPQLPVGAHLGAGVTGGHRLAAAARRCRPHPALLRLRRFELPAATTVADPSIAAAQAAALDFVGAASGSPAGLAATAAAGGHDLGRDAAGWPRWQEAARVAVGAAPGALAPEPALLAPFAGMTVLAETTTTPDPAASAALASAVAGGLTGHGVDLAWTAANEPDLGGRRTPEEWAARTRDFATAVRAGDHDAPVVGPTLADGWDSHQQGMSGWDWLVRWADAGGLAAVDAATLHLHMLDEETGTLEREQLELVLARARALLDRLDDRRLPLWVTEMGWRGLVDDADGYGPGETGRAVNEADQADLLVRAGLLAVASGVARFYAFHLHGFRWFSEGTRFDWGVVTGVSDAPKAAFLALRRLVRLTAGAAGYRLLPTAARARAVHVDRGAEHTLVAWQWSGGPGLFRLDRPPAGCRLQDLLGEPADGSDLRRPVVVTWRGAADPVLSWAAGRLADRYPHRTHPEDAS